MVRLATITEQHERATATKQRSYLVLNGEVLVISRGRPVDLIEQGEVVDTRFWPGAEYLATIGCKVVPLGTYH